MKELDDKQIKYWHLMLSLETAATSCTRHPKLTVNIAQTKFPKTSSRLSQRKEFVRLLLDLFVV